MTLGLIFWIMMLLWLVFWLAGNWNQQVQAWSPIGNNVFLFLLFLLLGWKAFGAPIQG